MITLLLQVTTKISLPLNLVFLKLLWQIRNTRRIVKLQQRFNHFLIHAAQIKLRPILKTIRIRLLTFFPCYTYHLPLAPPSEPIAHALQPFPRPIEVTAIRLAWHRGREVEFIVGILVAVGAIVHAELKSPIGGNGFERRGFARFGEAAAYLLGTVLDGCRCVSIRRLETHVGIEVLASDPATVAPNVVEIQPSVDGSHGGDKAEEDGQKLHDRRGGRSWLCVGCVLES